MPDAIIQRIAAAKRAAPDTAREVYLGAEDYFQLAEWRDANKHRAEYRHDHTGEFIHGLEVRRVRAENFLEVR